MIITYRETEFNFDAPGLTPLTLAGSQVRYDADTGTDDESFFGANAEVAAQSATGTMITIGSTSPKATLL